MKNDIIFFVITTFVLAMFLCKAYMEIEDLEKATNGEEITKVNTIIK